MTTPTNSIAFHQFVRLPPLGSAWVQREADRPEGAPLFGCSVDRDDAGTVEGITLRAGRWIAVADRPVSDAWPIGTHYSVARPLATAAWIALGAPLVTLAGIAACLLACPARHALASLQRRPARS